MIYRPYINEYCTLYDSIWIVDAHRDAGEHFVVRADEKLTAFVEVERTIQCPGGHNTAIRIN